jgi:lipopolysaccharide transport system ATP-binding protein
MMPAKPLSVIQLSHVTKAYPIYGKAVDRVKEAFHPLRRKYHRPFYALNDISFNVRKGETLGIVGRNGSGKSTLLQLLCNVLPPTAGGIHVCGKVAALLELGSGFNEEFSGRENVHLNAGILGLSQREIDERFAQIVDFSGIGDFIDQPLKYYSSGMVVRLAFSVMIHVDADILVIDEALAVGDEAFQRKCYSRIAAFIEQGNTLVFVSHSPQTVIELCDRALLLENGRLVLDDAAKNVIREYHRRIYSPGSDAPAEPEVPEAPADAAPEGLPADGEGDALDERDQSFWDPDFACQSTMAYDRQGARIHNVRMLNTRAEKVNTLSHAVRYTLAYDVEFLEDARKVVFGSMLKTITGLELGGILSHPLAKPIQHVARGARFEVRIHFHCCLTPGVYFLNAGVTGDRNGESGYLHRVIDALMLRVQPIEGQQFTGLVDFSHECPPEIREFAPKIRIAENQAAETDECRN